MLENKLAKWIGTAAVTCGLLLSASSAQALAVGANAVEISAPLAPAVNPGALEADNQMKVFFESTTILSTPLGLDASAPGILFNTSLTSPGTIAAGMEVNSFFIHFDPIGSNLSSSVGELNFDFDILGLIFLDSTLDASDFLGAPGTAYPTGTAGRGFDPLGDQIAWLGSSPNRLDISLLASSGVDQIRVITKTPEPATYMLMGFGVLFAVVLKRRKAAVKA